MAGIEEQCGVGIGREPREALQRKVHVALTGIDCSHDLEANVSQYRGNILGVVTGIGKRNAGSLVVGISYHESDAPLRLQRRVGRPRRRGDALPWRDDDCRDQRHAGRRDNWLGELVGTNEAAKLTYETSPS